MMSKKSKFIAIFVVFIMAFQLVFQSETIKVIAASYSIEGPEINNPEEGDEVDYDDFKVRWDKVSGANYYKISLRDVTLDKKIISDETSKNYYRIDKSDLEQGHWFKVAVGAYQDEQNFKWGEPVFFSVEEREKIERPYVYSVDNGETVPYEDLEVKWKSVDGAEEYKIGLRNMRTNHKYVDEILNSRSFTVDRSNLIPGDRYRLTVGAYDEDGESSWRELYFKVQKTPVPVRPNVKYPKNNSEIEQKSFSVRWDSVKGATRYNIALRNLRTNKVELNKWTTKNYYTISKSKLIPGDRYRLAVGAFNNNGKGSWRQLYFTVENIPVRPNVKYPKNNSEIEQKSFSVRWDSVKGATKYNIALRNLRTNKVVLNQWTTRNYYTISKSKLIPGDRYRLEVGAFNNNGKGSWRKIYFTVQNIPVRPNVKYPKNYSEIEQKNFSVRWDSVKGATKYNIALRNLRTNKVVLNQWTTRNYYTISKSKLIPGDRYRLEVGAFNNKKEGSWRKIYFTVEKGELEEVKLLYPKKNEKLPFENVRIRWNKVTGVKEYKIKVYEKKSGKEIFSRTTRSTYATLYKSKIKQGMKYRLEITAVDNFKNETSNSVKFSIIDKSKPMLNGFNIDNRTLKIDEKFGFEGYVYGVGKDVDTVTINIKGPNNKKFGSRYFRKTNISTSRYYLNKIPDIQIGKNYMKTPGVYWIHVWAKVEGGKGALLAKKKITVKEN